MLLGAGTRVCADGAELMAIAGVLVQEIEAITGVAPSVSSEAPGAGDIHLRVDPGVPPGYRLRIGDGAEVVGRDPRSVAHGTATLLQAIDVAAAEPGLPAVVVEDAPVARFRGVSVDCARAYQPPDVLRRVIQLCRFYKIGHLHLHLTDDEACAFPSSRHPGLATPGRSYTRGELEALVRYAEVRGVDLVPELDVPGHAAALARALPELAVPGCPGLVHMGRETTYELLGDLLGEMCEVFHHAPYVHIGGDEVDLAGIAADPEALSYMRRHGLASADELFQHFIRRMRDVVVAHGREAVVWEGFRRSPRALVPDDVIVLVWDTSYHRPEELAAAGHRVVNASWKPLYIVGDAKLGEVARKWNPEQVHAWNMFRWEHHDEPPPLQLEADAAVLGAQMCAWELEEASVVADLRTRVPVFSERIWNPGHGAPWQEVCRRFTAVDAMLSRFLR